MPVDETVAKRLRFDTVLSDLSATFVSLPADQVDGKIQDGLRRLGEFSGLDRCYLVQFSHDKRQFQVTHLWSAPGIEPDEDVFDIVVNEQFPWYMNLVLGGEVFAYSNIDELPGEASNEKEYCRSLGIRSFAIVPLAIGGSIIGSLGLVACRSARTWSEELLQRYRLAGEVFANALTRRRAEKELRKSEQRFRLLLESTNAVPWEANARNWQFTYVGPQAARVFGYPIDQWHEKNSGSSTSIRTIETRRSTSA